MVIDVQGVGFQVAVPTRTLETLAVGQDVTMNTYLHVREDALELYGFATTEELHLFEKLLSVSGVGPKMAMAILSAANVNDIEQAIERGQAGMLTAVSGVGTKTAERIIVDLRGKLNRDEDVEGDLGAIIGALVSLGYTTREAREVAAKTPANESVENRIKSALKQLGR